MLTSIDLRDLTGRALHTFWQAFLAVVGATWAASGLDIGSITDLDSARRFGLGALAALAAAALSAGKTTMLALLAQRREARTEAQDTQPLPGA